MLKIKGREMQTQGQHSDVWGSYTPDGDWVLFGLGEGSSTSINGSFPLLLPFFTAALLNGDIYK